MKQSFLKRVIRRFRGKEDGAIMVETVITLPLLIWALVATYEFFEVHRYKSVREKATYTLADMLSRETSSVNDIYVDNAKKLFDGITSDDGVNQIRVSVLIFDRNNPNDDGDDEYIVRWSETRGTGSLTDLTDADMESQAARLPERLADGEELILVEAQSGYQPRFNVGLSNNVPIETRMFTKIRFVSQLCWEGTYCDG